jgi:hypothetical protein
VLARRLPDVLSGDPHPAVAVRRRDHRLEQPAVGLLDLALASQLRLSLAQPNCKAVANPLKLGDAEHAGTANGRHAPLDARPREGRGEELPEPLLEQRDLPPELVPGPPLDGGISDSLERDAIEAPGRLVR